MAVKSSISTLRLLVIEDNSADIALLRHGLDITGTPYELVILHDGEIAADFIQQHAYATLDPEFCLVVVDLYLPKHDGVTLLKLLREAPAFAHIKIAVVTSNASPEVERQLGYFNIELYRKKPIELRDFVRLAGELMDICAGKSAAALA